MYPSGKTHLYALLAHPVAHVRAAEFFNPVFEAKGVDAFLFPLHVLPEDLADVVPRLVKLRNMKGVGLTIPHKETMARLCDELGTNGRLVGAVNTVRFEEDGRLPGANAKVGPPDPTGHDVVINATSLGLHETDELPVDPNLLRSSMEAVEIIAAVEVTPFRRAALDIGCRTMGGRAMVDHQIEAQLRFFGEIA